VQAKQSSDASGMCGLSVPFAPPVPIQALAPGLPGAPALRAEFAANSARLAPQAPKDNGMLHDARNLVGTIGLYCDLLSMPGVLKPEHHHYAEELRLLSTRSGALIERLMQSSLAQGGPQSLGASAAREAEAARSLGLIGVRATEVELMGSQVSTVNLPTPVTLQAIVKRCAGLLGRVANGRPIEISYGPAASVPILVDEEAVERILVNLVRNSAAAMNAPDQPVHAPGDAIVRAVYSTVLQRTADGTADETPGAIRIGVGVMNHSVDDPGPRTKHRARLTVEDSGCGMTPEQLERVLCGVRAPSRGSHGIGFIVVRELVAASSGELRVMSALGVGTWVQIEWPTMEESFEETAQRRSDSIETVTSSQLTAAYGLLGPGRARMHLRAPLDSRTPEGSARPR